MRYVVAWTMILAGAVAWWGIGTPAVRGQEPVGRAVAVQGRAQLVQTTGAPFPPLSVEHQRYLDQLLAYWEQSSGRIKRYRCKFTRWQYDPVFGPRGAAKTIARGVVQYAAPDKGMYEVREVFDYKAPEDPRGQPTYVKREGGGDEKWICDGQSVFEFDFQRKRLLERPLPPEMRGKAIADGPLPFLFGAKADKIKRRYWVRVITPRNAKGEYWLEAWPKTQQDRSNFQKVEIIIDEKDFLPKAIQIFDPHYDPHQNPSRTAFQFTDREVNFIDLKDLDALQLFHRAFHRPATPKGWKKEVLPLGTAGGPTGQARHPLRAAPTRR